MQRRGALGCGLRRNERRKRATVCEESNGAKLDACECTVEIVLIEREGCASCIGDDELTGRRCVGVEDIEVVGGVKRLEQRIVGWQWKDKRKKLMADEKGLGRWY